MLKSESIPGSEEEADANPAAGSPDDPYEATVALYKSRCEDLEREIVTMQETIAMEKMQHEALQAKLNVLQECYRQVDDDLGTWYRLQIGSNVPDIETPPSYLALVLRCAELQWQLHNLVAPCACNRSEVGKAGEEEQLGKLNSDEPKPPFQMGANSDDGKFREGLIGFLQEAMDRVALARDVGTRLRSKYAEKAKK